MKGLPSKPESLSNPRHEEDEIFRRLISLISSSDLLFKIGKSLQTKYKCKSVMDGCLLGCAKISHCVESLCALK